MAEPQKKKLAPAGPKQPPAPDETDWLIIRGRVFRLGRLWLWATLGIAGASLGAGIVALWKIAGYLADAVQHLGDLKRILGK